MGWFENAINDTINVGTQVSTGGMVGYNNGQFGSGVTSNALGMGGRNPQQLFYGANAGARQRDLEEGFKKGREIFYDNPDMQMLREKRLDLAKGYSGKELGAMREQARGEVEGQRSNYLRQMAGKQARAGIGGARAAAAQSVADQGFQKNRAELERKMTLDNANLTRQGTDSLQDFLLRQRFGELSTGMGYGQLGTADRSADAQARIASQQRDRGIIGQMFQPFEGLF